MTDKNNSIALKYLQPVIFRNYSGTFARLSQILHKAVSLALIRATLSFKLNKFRNILKKVRNLKNILVIIDSDTNNQNTSLESARVIRFYFPAAAIDYLCNLNPDSEKSLPVIQYYNRINYLSQGKGIPTAEDMQSASGAVSAKEYSLILNFSPFIGKELFERKPNVIHLYDPIYTYQKYLAMNGKKTPGDSALIQSFLHKFLHPLMLEKDYPNTLNEEYLLHIQSL